MIRPVVSLDEGRRIRADRERRHREVLAALKREQLRDFFKVIGLVCAFLGALAFLGWAIQ